MGKRHDALFDDVLSGFEGEGEAAKPAPQPRGGGRFLKRSSALADRLSGDRVEQTLRWVDPARCRMWPRHNRRYDLLDERRCADLIEGFKAQGRQEFPAIVRAIAEDPDYDYEVICGARRHWTVSWLRARNYTQFRFLIELRALSDEEAFRLSDVENRDRADLSDFERALDYADALERYYGGRQRDMAQRLELSESWLSRWLLLAKLPPAIIAAYADVTGVRERHARALRPLMAKRAENEAILAAAATLTDEQARRATQGQPPLDGADVFARLKAATKAPKPKKTLGRYKDAAGKLVATAKPMKGGGLTLDIAGSADRAAALKAAEEAIAAHFKA